MNPASGIFSQLRFPPEREREFLDDYYGKSLKQVRFALLLGMVLYGLFGALDAVSIPEVKVRAWFIRYGVVTPFCLLTFAATYLPLFRRYMQEMLALLLFICGGGVIMIAVVAHKADSGYYPGGLILVIIFGYTLLKLRFLHAACSALGIMLSHEIANFWIGPSSLSSLLYDNSVFFAANFIGMISCYQSEVSARRDFIRNRDYREIEESRHIRERENLREAVAKATRSLQESEAKFRALAQTTTAAIFMHRGGNFIYANPAGEAVTGYTNEEVLAKDFWALVHPDYVELIKERGRARLRGEQLPPEYEFKIVKKNGEERWVAMTAGTIEYEGKPAIIGTLFDITDRKEAAEAMRRYSEMLAEKVKERTAELEEAQKLAIAANKAKSEFLANISHELRTPLNSIIGFSEVMKDGMAGPLTDDQKEYLSDIWESGKHLLRLINDILDLSKIESGMMELELSDVSLKEVLEGCLFMFKEKAVRHHIKLHTEISDAIASMTLTGDERKIKQVVLNLLANAFKFSADGGSVGVTAEVRNGAALVSVWDRGIGIADEDLDKLFKPFRQLDTTLTKKYEGTGLGLHLSRKIVELHGGRIWAESEPGAGSRFSFTIPRRN